MRDGARDAEREGRPLARAFPTSCHTRPSTSTSPWRKARVRDTRQPFQSHEISVSRQVSLAHCYGSSKGHIAHGSLSWNCLEVALPRRRPSLQFRKNPARWAGNPVTRDSGSQAVRRTMWRRRKVSHSCPREGRSGRPGLSLPGGQSRDREAEAVGRVSAWRWEGPPERWARRGRVYASERVCILASPLPT